MPPSNQKIYAFVDESGQETLGALFLVSVVVTDQEYETLNDLLLELERQSKKGLGKWGKTRFEYRVSYISAVIAQPLFRELIYFSRYTETKAYFDLTVATTAKAIAAKDQLQRPATVVVDGLTGKSIDRFKVYTGAGCAPNKSMCVKSKVRVTNPSHWYGWPTP